MTAALPISLSELSDLIGQIYAAPLTSDWDDFLDRMIDLTQSNKAFFFIQSLTSEQPAKLSIKTTFEYQPEFLQAYQHKPLEDPFYIAMKDLQEGETVYCNKLVRVDDFVHTDYYQNVFIPMRTYHAIGSVLVRDGHHESAFAITRDHDAEAYQQQHISLMSLISPHLSQAMQIFNTLQLHKNYLNLNQSVMDQSDKAIFVCDQHGKILLHNALADILLTDEQLFTLENNALVLLEPTTRQRFALHMQSCALFATSDIYCKEAIVLDQPDGTSVTISVAPLRGSLDFTCLPKQACLVTAGISNNLDWRTLAKEFTLTKAEISLLKALYKKKKISQLTYETGVSYNTLRTHLQVIFKKLEVNSQTELMVKLNSFV